jgi:hypothetical protein
MCGSSSATRTWNVGCDALRSATISNEGGDVVAIAAKLEQELPDICSRRQQNKKNRFGRHRGNNRHTSAVLKDGSKQLGSANRGAQFIGRSNDRRDERGNAFWVDAGYRLAVNEEAVAAEHNGCFDSFALSNRSYEVPDAGQLDSSRKVVAKLEIENLEVKR